MKKEEALVMVENHKPRLERKMETGSCKAQDGWGRLAVGGRTRREKRAQNLMPADIHQAT